VIYRSHPRYKGCIGHWIFNEGKGGIIKDISGFGHHGNHSGDLDSDWHIGLLQDFPSHLNGGDLSPLLDFDSGDSDVVIVGNIGDLGSVYSVAAWVLSQDVTANTGQWVTYRTNTQGDLLNLAIQLDHNNNDARFLVRGSDNILANATASAVLSANTWYHMVGTRNGDDIELFIDGLSAATDTAAIGIVIMNQFGIGAVYDDNINAWVDFVDGSLADVRVYNRVLRQSEITSLYRDPWLEFTAPKVFGHRALEINIAAASADAFIYEQLRYRFRADDGPL